MTDATEPTTATRDPWTEPAIPPAGTAGPSDVAVLDSSDAPVIAAREKSAELPRTIAYVPLDSLIADPRNPKSHDLSLIDSSYDRFGVVDVVTVDGRTGYIISGHGRTMTLREAEARGDTPPEGVVISTDGTWLVPVNKGWSSKNDAEAAAALIAMNRVTEMGGWVDETLLDLLQSISDSGNGFEGIGYSETDMDDLKHLLEDVPDLDALADEWDPDAVPGSGSGKAVTIKLMDVGLIAAWHEARDSAKNDDEAFRSLLANAPEPAAKPERKRTTRTKDATVEDLVIDPEIEAPFVDEDEEDPRQTQTSRDIDALEDLDVSRETSASPQVDSPVETPADDGLDWSTAGMAGDPETVAQEGGERSIADVHVELLVPGAESEDDTAVGSVEIDLSDIDDTFARISDDPADKPELPVVG